MTLADNILAKIQAEREARYGSLKLPENFIAPNYGGRSIVNVPASIVRMFGGQFSTAPLDPLIIGSLGSGVRRIVLVIADALGYDKFTQALDANPQNGFHSLLADGGMLAPLTSVFPSTTTAALTALWTGYTPAEHGFMGYQLWLREYGVRAQMITFTPVATEKLGDGQLLRAGFEPDKFLAVPSLPQTLADWDVPVYNLIERPYVKSVLSRVQIRGQRESRGFVSSSDLWFSLRALLERRPAEQALFVAYWSKVDTIAHVYGPSSGALPAEIDNFAYSFEREFLRRLSPAAREGTLFLLTADHGQIDTPPAEAIYLRDHPALRDSLLMGFTGDPRAAYLTVRSGEAGRVRDYLETHLGSELHVLDSQAALSAGLFGGGRFAPETPFRIGDLIALPRARQFLYDGDDVPHMQGRHGGLSPQEMLVPLLVSRLDG
jgi:hypothetical protein